jgi:hypothetical protein
MKTLFKTLGEYLYQDGKYKPFIVPNYQRGYKWAVEWNPKEKEGYISHVERLCDNLITAYQLSFFCFYDRLNKH